MKTTRNLNTPPRPAGRVPLITRIRWFVADLLMRLRWQVEDPLIVTAIAAFALALAGWAGWAAVASGPAAAGAVVIYTATPALVVPSSLIGDGPRLQAAATAYDSPHGRVLGAVEPGRGFVAVATWGSSWVHVDLEGSGRVWLRVEDAGLPAGVALADLRPEPTAQIIVVQAPAPPPAPAAPAAPPAPQPAAAAPAPAPEPAPLAPMPEAPGWYPPMASGVNPAAAAAPACPLVLSPDELDRCLAAAAPPSSSAALGCPDGRCGGPAEPPSPFTVR
jgi:hypothetical protein